MSDKLKQAIEDFRNGWAANLALWAPDCARDNCQWASEHFCELLKSRGIRARVRGLCFDSKTVSHWIVQVGATPIDWTARQFNKDVDYPLCRLMDEREITDREYLEMQNTLAGAA
jgi:hypothetical protein